MAPPHFWICPDGTRIAGDVLGPEGAPTVILAHGGGQTRRSWMRFARALAGRGFRVIAYDMRGHGESGWAAGGAYDEADLVSDLETIVAATGAARPILVGASAGGLAALATIGLGRIEAAGLCLVDIAVRTERAGYDRIRSFMLRGLKGFATVEEAADSLAVYRDEPRRPDVSGLERALRWGEDGRLRWHWDPAFLEARHRDLHAREDRLGVYARALECPVLMIRGGSSDMVSTDGVRSFLNLCPHAEYVDVADVGHMLVGDRNDSFGAAAIPFIEAVRDGTARRRHPPS